MACPYFEPTARVERSQWQRAPLGDPHDGVCRISGAPPPASALDELCNMGYARGRCPDFPLAIGPDAIRFGVTAAGEEVIRIGYVVERDHHPFQHGALEYVRAAAAFRNPPSDPTLRRQAESFAASYLRRAS